MATAVNDVTGDSIRTGVSNDQYGEGYERIFGKKEKVIGVYQLQGQFFKQVEGSTKDIKISRSEHSRLLYQLEK